MQPNKKRRRRTVFIVLLIILALLVALGVWQRNNIKALISAATQSQEQIEEQMQQNDQALKDAVADLPGVDIRDVTDEEREALRDGTLTLDELLDRLLEDSNAAPTETPDVTESPDTTPSPTPTQAPEPTETPEPTQTPGTSPTPEPTQSVQPSQSPQPTPTPTPEPTPMPSDPPEEQSDYERRLNELLARAFVLREEYLLALDNMQKAALEDYKAIPAEEREAKGLAVLVETYISAANKLEAECDAKMDALVAELKALQKEYGQSMDLVDTVKYTYANEKSLKKAWYMEELRKRGLI